MSVTQMAEAASDAEQLRASLKAMLDLCKEEQEKVKKKLTRQEVLEGVPQFPGIPLFGLLDARDMMRFSSLFLGTGLCGADAGLNRVSGQVITVRREGRDCQPEEN